MYLRVADLTHRFQNCEMDTVSSLRRSGVHDLRIDLCQYAEAPDI